MPGLLSLDHRQIPSYPAPSRYLTVVDASGQRYTYRVTPRRAAINPALVLGEAYMDGRLLIEQGDIADFLDLIGRNMRWDDDDSAWLSLWRPWRHLRFLENWNWARRARGNAAHHYDLSNRLFSLFLGEDLQYSCSYFAEPTSGPDEAQEAKKNHIAAKLDLKPGQRVLDIGCGWGELEKIHKDMELCGSLCHQRGWQISA